MDDGDLRIEMTFASPGWPAGPMITDDAYKALKALEGVEHVNIEIVWEPDWTPDKTKPKVRVLMRF